MPRPTNALTSKVSGLAITAAVTHTATPFPTDDWEFLDEFTRGERLKAMRHNNGKEALLGNLEGGGAYVPSFAGMSEAEFAKRHPHAVSTGRLPPVKAIMHSRPTLQLNDQDMEDDDVDHELLQGYTGDAPTRSAESDHSSPFSDASARKRTKPPSQSRRGSRPDEEEGIGGGSELHATEEVPSTGMLHRKTSSALSGSRSRSRSKEDEQRSSRNPRLDEVSSTDTHQHHDDNYPPPPTGSIILPPIGDSYHSMNIADVKGILQRRIIGDKCDARNLTKMYYLYNLMQLCAQLTLLPSQCDPSELQLNEEMQRQRSEMGKMTKSKYKRLASQRRRSSSLQGIADEEGGEGGVLLLRQLDLSNTQLGTVGPTLRPPTRFESNGDPILSTTTNVHTNLLPPSVIAPLDAVWIDEKTMPEPMDIQYRSVVLAYSMWPVIMSPSHALTHLILDNCALSDFDAYTLATILRHRKNSQSATSDKIPVVSAPPLNTLSLRLNDISDIGVNFLKKAVKYHRRIEYIWLEGNHRITTTVPPPSENRAPNPRFLTPFIDGADCGGSEEVVVLRQRLRANIKRNQIDQEAGGPAQGWFGGCCCGV